MYVLVVNALNVVVKPSVVDLESVDRGGVEITRASTSIDRFL